MIKKFSAGPFKTHTAAVKWAEKRGHDNYDLEQTGEKYLLHVFQNNAVLPDPLQR